MIKNFLILGFLILMSIGLVSAYDGDFCTSSHSPCGGGCTSTDLSSMYQGYDFVSDSQAVGVISGWNTSCITRMDDLFQGSNFNQDISGWNTSSVISMAEMFNSDVVFNQSLNSWDVSHVTEFGGMFTLSSSFNQPLNHWNTSSLTSMGAMFGYTPFNQDISSWDVSHVTTMFGSFGSSSFNQPLNSWNTSSVTDMSYMFYGNSVFNQSLNSWDTSHVTSMIEMFNGASSFNQPIGSWNVSNLQDASRMFSGVNLSVSNYDSLLNGWSQESLQSGVYVDFGFSQYSVSGEVGRNILINTHGWTISDGGLYASPVVPSTVARGTSSGSGSTPVLVSQSVLSNVPASSIVVSQPSILSIVWDYIVNWFNGLVRG